MTAHRFASFLTTTAAAVLLATQAWAQPAAPATPDAPPPVAAPGQPGPVGGPATRPDQPPPLAAPGARPPRPGAPGRAGMPPPPPVAQAQATVSGQVSRWLLNPNGEVDGLLLADGTQVKTPPHLSAALLRAVKLQDTVQVTGRRGEQAQVLRAETLRNTANGRSVTDEPPALGSLPAPRPPADGALTAMNASGRIGTVLYTGRGDANGVLLQDGTIVRFAPHAGAALAEQLKPGAPFYARGYGTRNALGQAFEATAIGSTADNARDVFAPPRPLPRG